MLLAALPPDRATMETGANTTKIGIEYRFISNPAEKEWLRQRVTSVVSSVDRNDVLPDGWRCRDLVELHGTGLCLWLALQDGATEDEIVAELADFEAYGLYEGDELLERITFH